jgi:ring-1,2-phenylacetyl-CoA epoxidase subunit PaaC
MLMQPYHKYLLHLADNPLILGQRLGEWCGHGPVLEQDIALTNTSLDLIGQARMLYQYVATLPGQEGQDEDKLAMMRLEHEYLNLLLVEQPNLDFGHTIVRQFLYDAFNLLQYEALSTHPDSHLQAIAVKTLKEIKYHYRYSSEWMLRLGDGTETSHGFIQTALHALWRYTGEMFVPADYEREVIASGQAPDIATLQAPWLDMVSGICREAGLQLPANTAMQHGGKQGRHTEYMGYLLAELQYMQRAYPDMKW